MNTDDHSINTGSESAINTGSGAQNTGQGGQAISGTGNVGVSGSGSASAPAPTSQDPPKETKGFWEKYGVSTLLAACITGTCAVIAATIVSRSKQLPTSADQTQPAKQEAAQSEAQSKPAALSNPSSKVPVQKQ